MMAANTTIPVTVTGEAQARITELGVQREFAQMIEHAKQVVPGLRCIDVVLDENPCPPFETWIIIEAHRDDPPGDQVDRTTWNWGGWVVQMFPTEVYSHFFLRPTYEGPANGR
jgi:hypothetical protein